MNPMNCRPHRLAHGQLIGLFRAAGSEKRIEPISTVSSTV
jgi:hypothetical protein